MICTACGKTNPDGFKFCGECAAPIAAAATSSPGVRPPTAPPLPSSFAGGRYLVRGFLGEGGTKRVYLAHDTKLDRDVAFALIKTEGLDADGLVRVRYEAQAMARLGDHPSIVMVHDIGDEDGPDGQSHPFMVSQHMPGGSVEDVLLAAEDHRVPLDQAVRIAIQMCDALDHAHRQGIIHRDLKPGNVWLGTDGTAKLGDFGLAITLDRSRLTVAGMMVGTVSYMAPEQAHGRVPDARSDLYALGAMLYEMVTGRPPFTGDDAVAVISQHINTPPIAPAYHNPGVPPALNALILRLLEKNPEQRPASAAAARDALRSIDLVAPPRGASSVVAAQTPAAANPLYRHTFVGREGELRQLHAAFDAALSGQGALIMVVGEPGIGKTTVTEQLATYAALRGGRTLVGHCYEEGSLSLPYLPFVEAMRLYVLASNDAGALKRELGSGAAEVARIVSEVRERVEIEPSAPTNPEEERYRLLQAVSVFLRNAAAAQPLVIVLEDLHDADRGTLDLLTHLTRSLAGARLLIVGTYRDVEVDRTHPLANALVELRRIAQFERVLLRGLTPEEVQRMLSAIVNQDVQFALAETVHRQTEGNPLFVQEVVRYLAEEGLIAREDGRWRRTTEQLALAIPEGLRDVIGKRLSRLSAECNRLLAIAAVIGRDFALVTLRAVVGVPEDDLITALEEAVGVGVLEERSRAGVVHYHFAHAFFRQSLYEELIAPRRIRMHQQVAQALEEQYASRLAEHATELAEHFSYSSAEADLTKAVRYGELAAERASAVYAHSEAAELYRRALEVQEVLDPDDIPRRCDLLVASIEPRRLAGNIDGSRAAAFEAAGLARRAGDTDRFVAAATAASRSPGLIGIPDPELVALLEDALRALPESDSHERATLLSRLAFQIANVIGVRDAQPPADEALAMARRLGDRGLLEFVLIRHLSSGTQAGDLTGRAELVDELIRVTEASGSIEGRTVAVVAQITQALLAGDLGEFEMRVSSHQELAEKYHLSSALLNSLEIRSESNRIAGDFDEALRLLRLANEASAGLIDWQQLTEVQGGRGWRPIQLLAERGELDDTDEEQMLANLERYPSAKSGLVSLIAVAWRLGHVDRCRDALNRLAPVFNELVHRPQWDAIAASLAEACDFLGDEARARELYQCLVPDAGRHLVLRAAAPRLYGPADRYLGMLASLLRRWEDAERHFEEALRMTAALPSPPYLAQTQYDYARMLLRRDAAGDRTRALSLLRDAGEAAQRMGMRGLLERVLTLKLEAQGVSSTDVLTSISAVATAVQRDGTDLRPHAAADGSVTIMFSDIEDSTPINERLGDQRWMELLRAHNAIISEQIAAHDGNVVKTAGDGFMMSFRQPLKALRAAIAIQRAFSAHNAQHAEHPLVVRIGIHTGTPVAEGGDYYGNDVTLAYRIADTAHGGEIVVSARVRELVGGASDVEFGEPRELELKGLSGRRMVYTATAT